MLRAADVVVEYACTCSHAYQFPSQDENPFLTHVVPAFKATSSQAGCTVLSSSASLISLPFGENYVHNGTWKGVQEEYDAQTKPSVLSAASQDGSDASTIVTAGRNGVVKVQDLHTGNAIERRLPNKEAVSAVALDNERRFLAAGTELVDKDGPGDVCVYVWDLHQNSGTPIRAFTDSHTDTLTALYFLPKEGTGATTLRLISSSTDGLITLFDLAFDNEDDAVLEVFNNRASVQHLLPIESGPTSGLDVFIAISHDEILKVFSLATGDQLGPEHGVRLKDVFACDYALGVKAEKRAGRVALALGTNKEETALQPRVEIIMLEPYQIIQLAKSATHDGSSVDLTTMKDCNIFRLHHAHGDEVVRDFLLVKTQQSYEVVTSGEDSTVRLWSPLNSESTSTRKRKSDLEHELRSR